MPDTERCTLCDPRPEATDEECDKWPGFFRGCLCEAQGGVVNGWKCDGKGNLTRVGSEYSEGREP